MECDSAVGGSHRGTSSGKAASVVGLEELAACENIRGQTDPARGGLREYGRITPGTAGRLAGREPAAPGPKQRDPEAPSLGTVSGTGSRAV